ncbi:Globin [Dufourea novaeangliae]|uniref:Globin n=1 Tax=Dufourea novaeangliae TaxID=178035 RepID=A0A154NY93_DUFNO|nr:Globin [Dufourea novaeangliae]
METFLRLFGISSNDNRIDQATGLTEKQKRLVQNTWAVVRKDEVGSGIAVMTAFFNKYPETQRQFSAFKDIPLNELPNNKRFQAHCTSVITALSNVIDSLHDPGLMEASLIGLAERHKKRGQRKVEFQIATEIDVPELRLLASKLKPDECVRFVSLDTQYPLSDGEVQKLAREQSCFRRLIKWICQVRTVTKNTYPIVNDILERIGRVDLVACLTRLNMKASKPPKVIRDVQAADDSEDYEGITTIAVQATKPKEKASPKPAKVDSKKSNETIDKIIGNEPSH